MTSTADFRSPPQAGTAAGTGYALLEPFERAWQYRELIRAVVRRELTSRFRDSMLGWVWAIFAPLVLLAGYTAVYTIMSAAPPGTSIFDIVASIFCGLIVFSVFSELLARAPTLLHEHAQFVKKSIFPSETIAWTSTIRAFVYGAISFCTLLVTLVVTGHGLPPTLLITPLIFIPFFLLMLGMVWFLMALGAFTKDVSHLVISISPILMFVTPVFFRLEQVPASIRPFLRLNLITNYIDMFRDVVLNRSFPDPIVAIPTVLASILTFVVGYRFFQRYKAVIVDVI